jgi:hypothetical protein
LSFSREIVLAGVRSLTPTMFVIRPSTAYAPARQEGNEPAGGAHTIDTFRWPSRGLRSVQVSLQRYSKLPAQSAAC